VERYVRESLSALGRETAGPITACYLDAGVMNYVYRVTTPDETFYLKQALDRVKQHDRLGPDLAGVSPERIRVESRALSLLATELSEEFRDAVPAVVWHDEASNILWTQETAPGSTSLQQALEAGDCDVVAARTAGRILGAVHAARSGSVPCLWPTPEADRGNWLRFLAMRTTGVLPRAELTSGAETVVRELYQSAIECERVGVVSHLDAAPKNLLLSPGQVVLLDFELGASISDPAYAPGFLAGHYLLMGENHPSMRHDAWRAASAVASGYLETAPAVDGAWAQRLARFAGLTMLYRLYGSSPAPYLNPARYQDIRVAGVCVLLAGELPPPI
jgi:tRNA A-37 threonylcarbamoyl transferase component Bud32